MKYKITKSDKSGFVEVDGDPVKFRGYGNFRFFIHKAYHEETSLFNGGFVVSEFTSGGAVGSGITIKDAMECARMNLKSVGVAGFDVMIKNILSGLSGFANQPTKEQEPDRSVANPMPNEQNPD
jgi:hypothetical protein